MDDGPAPKTDHDYIIKIYERQGYQGKDIKTLCDAIHDHENRITTLERANACEESFHNGKTSIWITYKEFVIAIVTVALSVSGTILLFRMGINS
jgi:hypothetical protein